MLILISLFGMLTPVLSSRFAESSDVISWLVDLLAHWQWLYLLTLLIGIGFALLRNWRYLGVLVLVPIPWLTASESAPETTHIDSVFSVGTANVNVSNRSTDKLREWIDNKKPDVLVLSEVSHLFAGELKQLEGYRHQALFPDSSPFGIGILAKYPLSDVVIKCTRNEIPHIEALVDWNGKIIRVIAFHPMPPLSPGFHVERNQTLATLTQHTEFPTIIAGDFNATPWSSAFNGPTNNGFRRATGLFPSWPTLAQGVMGIPIDHVLVSDHWKVLKSLSSQDIGSDHYPRLTRLVL